MRRSYIWLRVVCRGQCTRHLDATIKVNVRSFLQINPQLITSQQSTRDTSDKLNAKLQQNPPAKHQLKFPQGPTTQATTSRDFSPTDLQNFIALEQTSLTLANSQIYAVLQKGINDNYDRCPAETVNHLSGKLLKILA